MSNKETIGERLLIEEATGNRDRYMNLLLIGDEDAAMIARYLDRGVLYVGSVAGEAVAVCLATEEPGGTTEVKNLAVAPEYRRRGIGAAMLRHAERANCGHSMILGTGATPSTLRFYEGCGYRYSHRVPNFFTDNYDHPIVEEGVLLTDMIYLSKDIPAAGRCHKQLYSSPFGNLLLGACEGKLRLCLWYGEKMDELTGSVEDEAVTNRAALELDEYFAGRRREFSIAVDPVGTEFQRLVWAGLRSVGYGERISYSELARRIGKGGSVRAVANAVGRNPLSIFLPCHRIIGSDGRLHGYAGGVEAKRGLLQLESASSGLFGEEM